MSHYIDVMSLAPERLARVDQWLSREGSMGYLSWESASLLDRRLAVRRRANALFSAAAVLAVAAIGMSTASAGNTVGAGAVSGSVMRWWLLAAVLLAAASVGRACLVARGERALTEGLTRRVTSDRLMTLWRRLGVSRSIAVLLVLAVNVWVLIALPALGASGALVALYAASLIVVFSCSAVVARRLLLSPTVAIDESSLTIDQRLRANDLMTSMLPLLLTAVGICAPIDISNGTGAADTLSTAIFLLVFAFVMLDALGKRSLNRPPGRAPGRLMGHGR
jgi:hypothetical protein